MLVSVPHPQHQAEHEEDPRSEGREGQPYVRHMNNATHCRVFISECIELFQYRVLWSSFHHHNMTITFFFIYTCFFISYIFCHEFFLVFLIYRWLSALIFGNMLRATHLTCMCIPIQAYHTAAAATVTTTAAMTATITKITKQ